MFQTVDVISFLACGLIAYEDFKKRSVHILTLVLFLLLSVAQLCLHFNSAAVIKYSLVNCALFSFIFLLQTIFVSLKKKQLFNPVNKTLGLFDILMIYLLACWFSPKTFLFFFTGSMILALIHILIKKTFSNGRLHTIPLAAYFSIFLMMSLLLKNLFTLNFYRDDFFKQAIAHLT